MTVSVVITTSPTELDPAAHAAMVGEVIASTQMFPELRGCDVIVAADGVPPEQADREADYWRALQQVLYEANQERPYVVPVVCDGWGHQANTLRAGLARVRTDLVLVMEHDTPLVAEPIEWLAAFTTIDQGDDLDVLRFYPETKVRDEWTHLLLDGHLTKYSPDKLRYLRTAQWSQRPHLARTSWYRAVMDTYFAPECRCYVEEVLQPVADHWNIGVGRMPDPQQHIFRLGIYAPMADSIQRSTHLDARQGGKRPAQVIAYPHDLRPPGAPGLKYSPTRREADGQEAPA